MEIHFAPLQGYTDHAYRTIHAKHAGGIDTYYTPFIRWEKGDVRSKDIRDILPASNKGLHLIPQIICGTTDDLNRISDVIEEQGYREIDINMGCPAPMQTKLLRGSGILPYPDRIEALLRATEQRSEVSYSVKMRLGLEQNDEWKAIVPLLNESRIVHVTLHPRVGKQMYKGEVDMESFAEFASVCTKAIIYNGDLTTLSEMQGIIEQFPQLKGMMIGRGLLARPSLATEFLEGKEWDTEHRKQLIKTMHADMLDYCRAKYVVDSQILLHIHAFWEYQQTWMEKKVYKKIMKAGSMRNYLEAVSNL